MSSLDPHQGHPAPIAEHREATVLRLDAESVLERLTVADFVGACDRALRLLGRGLLESPPRRESVTPGPGGDRLVLEMTASWPGRWRCRKTIEEVSNVASGRLDARRARIRLDDLARGRSVELDADRLTDMRTGAAGALALGYLSGGRVERVGLVGAGRIGRAVALAVDALLAPREVRFTSRDPARRRDFVDRVQPCLRAVLVPRVNLSECLAGCDAVVTAVPTPEPVLHARHLREARAVVVVAGDSRTRQLSPEAMEERGVLVDDLAQARESGEFRWARQQGREQRIALARGASGQVLCVPDAACGRLAASRAGPTTAYLTGLAAQDLCAAAMVYERWLEASDGGAAGFRTGPNT